MKCGNYKIDLGCGPGKQKGYIGLDKHDYGDLYRKGYFKIWDLESGCLPFCDNSAIEIYADSVLEHIKNLIPLMNDCWRVLKSEGKMIVIVPKAGSEGSFKDPTHVRFFLPKTFTYFQKGVRQENYDIKPWKVEFLDETEEEKSGIIKVCMKPDK